MLFSPWMETTPLARMGFLMLFLSIVGILFPPMFCMLCVIFGLVLLFLKSFTSTTIILIPKIENPSNFADFRPISLCNFIHKSLTKIIDLRLGNIFPSIIFDNQVGFVKGHNITDNMLFALELATSINRKSRGNNLIIKLDLQKSFDRISWDFLQQVHDSYGFRAHFCHLTKNAMEYSYFSISSTVILLAFSAQIERLNNKILYPCFFLFWLRMSCLGA